MKLFLLICLGGAAGTGVRYLLGVWFATRFGAGFPWSTMLVNLGGSFLLGLIVEAALRKRLSDDLRLILGTGVMGGLTTYSTFNTESLKMMQGAEWGKASAYFAGTIAGCLLAGVLGMRWGRTIGG